MNGYCKRKIGCAKKTLEVIDFSGVIGGDLGTSSGDWICSKVDVAAQPGGSRLSFSLCSFFSAVFPTCSVVSSASDDQHLGRFCFIGHWIWSSFISL